MGERKVSANFVMSEEMWALVNGFKRKGHIEHDEITLEDRTQHEATRLALEVIRDSPWVDLYEFDYTLKPLERKRWVAEETPEEYVARYREAKANGWQPDVSIYGVDWDWGGIK